MTTVLSNWTEGTPPWLIETMPQPPLETQKCCTHSTRTHLRGSMTMTQSEGRPTAVAKQAPATMEVLMITRCQPLSDSQPLYSTRAHLRGSMTMTQSEGRPTAVAKQAPTTMEALMTTPCQHLSDSQSLCPPPGFTEIAQMQRKEDPMESSPTPVITSILTQETIDPYEVVGMAVTATRLLRHQTTGQMMVHIQVCSEGIVGLGLDPENKKMVDEHPSLTIQELPDSDGWAHHSTTWHPFLAVPCSVFVWKIHHGISVLFSSGGYAMTFHCCFHLADMPWHFNVVLGHSVPYAKLYAIVILFHV